jgi:hypothetical protein
MSYVVLHLIGYSGRDIQLVLYLIFRLNIQIWAELLLEYGVLCLMQGQGPMLCEEVLHNMRVFTR